MHAKKTIVVLAMVGAIALLFAHTRSWGDPPADKDAGSDLAQQIFDTMIQVHGTAPDFRPVHAKGLVCHGTFTPSPEAATLSKAAHFQGASVPITVRFSDGAPDPIIPDNSPNAGPRGMAIRFTLRGGAETDIMTISHNGFVVANGQEFLALQKSVGEFAKADRQ